MLPTPNEAYDILPGCCFTSATSSLTLRTGSDGCASTASGSSPTSVTDWKSLTVS